MPDSSIIQFRNLTRNFGTVKAVNQLSFDIAPGIVFGFLGPNGAGKTTTIRMLLGLMAPSSGSAIVFGFDTRFQGTTIRSRTGALLEHPGVYEHMSAADNLEFFGRAYRIPSIFRKKRIHDMLSQMDLWERRDELVGNWSRGMKQRLALARALLHQPALVFLDEPTAGLDVISAKAVRDDIATLVAQHGTTVFLTTHNMAEAEKLCSQVAVIRAGSLVAIGSPQDLMNQVRSSQLEIHGYGFSTELLIFLEAQTDILQAQTQNGQLQLTVKPGTKISDIVTMLVEKGVQIEGVQQGKTSLEDVFLNLMEKSK
jgi:ABC-2 type transport system ATP-binding protein